MISTHKFLSPEKCPDECKIRNVSMEWLDSTVMK